MQSNPAVTTKDLAKELAKDCRTLEDIQELLKNVFKDTIQSILESEIEDHLGYEKNSVEGNNSGNSRNGYYKKTIKTAYGPADLDVPRDRNGEFEPQVIKKHQINANGIEEQIITMYAKGMSTRDIENHMRDIYGIDVSPGLVSKITDKILPQIAEWQSWPLDRIYPIVFLDAIHFKARKENHIVNKAVYSVLGVNMEGKKEILGIWVVENESASFWLGVLNDLKTGESKIY